ncbi:MAG: glycosyltransferase, partial [Actinomycetota bacterium]
MPAPTFSDPNLVPSRLEEPPSRAFSVVTLNAGWPEDLTRLAESLAARCGRTDYEMLAMSNCSDEVSETVEDLAGRDGRVRGLVFSQHVGFGGGMNAGIRQSLGEVVVVADSSIEAEG